MSLTIQQLIGVPSNLSWQGEVDIYSLNLRDAKVTFRTPDGAEEWVATGDAAFSTLHGGLDCSVTVELPDGRTFFQDYEKRRAIRGTWESATGTIEV